MDDTANGTQNSSHHSHPHESVSQDAPSLDHQQTDLQATPTRVWRLVGFERNHPRVVDSRGATHKRADLLDGNALNPTVSRSEEAHWPA